MQFSLKAILVTIAIIALLLVLPLGPLGALLFSAVWYLLPAALVTMYWHGDESSRTFGLAAGATYLAIAVDNKLGGAIPLGSFLAPLYVLIAGVIGLQLRKRLSGP
jgi:hypothetical protein